jgi:hypothetical protein
MTISLPASSREFLYLLRESLPVSSSSSAGGRPKFSMPPRCFGPASSLRVRCFGSDTSIFFDSLQRVQLSEGQVVDIKMAPDTCSLCTL